MTTRGRQIGLHEETRGLNYSDWQYPLCFLPCCFFSYKCLALALYPTVSFPTGFFISHREWESQGHQHRVAGLRLTLTGILLPSRVSTRFLQHDHPFCDFQTDFQAHNPPPQLAQWQKLLDGSPILFPLFPRHARPPDLPCSQLSRILANRCSSQPPTYCHTFSSPSTMTSKAPWLRRQSQNGKGQALG